MKPHPQRKVQSSHDFKRVHQGERLSHASTTPRPRRLLDTPTSTCSAPPPQLSALLPTFPFTPHPLIPGPFIPALLHPSTFHPSSSSLHPSTLLPTSLPSPHPNPPTLAPSMPPLALSVVQTSHRPSPHLCPLLFPSPQQSPPEKPLTQQSTNADHCGANASRQ